MSGMDPTIARSVLLFALAGLCEIGGGYLVWLWLREGRAVWLGALGGLVLFLYGVLPTFQPPEAPFGRVYAAYGGIFVALSLAWGGGSPTSGPTATTSSAARWRSSGWGSSCTRHAADLGARLAAAALVTASRLGGMRATP